MTTTNPMTPSPTTPRPTTASSFTPAPTTLRQTSVLSVEGGPRQQSSRVQLALNVSDIDAAVDFYGKLFGVEPAKRRPGYANFAIAEPPLKLVLIENADGRGAGVAGALNHLGVEVGDSAQVSAATQRLVGEGLDTLTQDATTCCYAVQDKVWVHDPDGAPWEVYTVLADAPADVPGGDTVRGDGQCCGDSTDGNAVGAQAAVGTTTEASTQRMTEDGVPEAAARACC